MSERVEVRGVIASKQGLSCEGYYMLSNRTAHLRDRLYISVRDGEALFLPKDREHFPIKEIEDFYIRRMNVGFFQSIGGKSGEVVFILEGPAAEEGAEAIQAALPDVDAAVNLPLAPRWLASIPQKTQHIQMLCSDFSAPYRPEHLPHRDDVPQPYTEEQADTYDPDRLARKLGVFEAEKRRALDRWGLLRGYDQMQAQRRREAAMQPKQTDPWRESFWT